MYFKAFEYFLNEEKSYMQLHVPWILNGESTILRHLISHFQTQINIYYIQQMSTIWETYTVQVVWNCRYFYGTVSLKKPVLIRYYENTTLIQRPLVYEIIPDVYQKWLYVNSKSAFWQCIIIFITEIICGHIKLVFVCFCFFRGFFFVFC